RMWQRCLLAGTAIWLAATTPAGAFIAYVSNEKGNTVSVIDTDKWVVTKTIKVGQRPRGIEFTRDGKFVLVAVGDDDTIQVIDAATQQVVDSLPSGPDPELFVQDAAGKILYVANENDNTVTIIDLEKRARVGDVEVGVEPEGMAISPDGKILINTSETTNMAHFIDTATRQIVANVLVDARPRFAEFKRDSSELWVSSEIGGTVSIIDPAKRAVTGKITFSIPGMRREAIQPVGIGMTKDGKTAFIALGPANRIAIVDGASHVVTKYLLVGQRVWHMAFTPDEKYLLVTNGISNDVSIIDVVAQKVIKTIQVGELPWGITIAQPCRQLTRPAPAKPRRTVAAAAIRSKFPRCRSTASAIPTVPGAPSSTSTSPWRRPASRHCLASTAPAKARCSRWSRGYLASRPDASAYLATTSAWRPAKRCGCWAWCSSRAPSTSISRSRKTCCITPPCTASIGARRASAPAQCSPASTLPSVPAARCAPSRAARCDGWKSHARCCTALVCCCLTRRRSAST